jgi:hypothetical protein
LFPPNDEISNQNIEHAFESPPFIENKQDDEEKANLRKKVQRLEVIKFHVKLFKLLLYFR